MVAIAQIENNQALPSTQQRRYSEQEIRLLEQKYGRLKEALEHERAKSSKLRRYIARVTQAQNAPTEKPIATTAIGMQQLVKQQAALLDQLYVENSQQQEAIDRMSKLNKQLLRANDKLRQSLIDLKRRFKPKKDAAIRDLEPLAQRLARQAPLEDLEQEQDKTGFKHFLSDLKRSLQGTKYH